MDQIKSDYSLCLADGGMFHPTPEITDSSRIHLDHAPVITLSTVYGQTTGMCLKDNCWHDDQSDLDWKLTWYADLFSNDPPLTQGQQQAVDALNMMSTPYFWLQAAHENGIVGKDDVVLNNMANAHVRLDAIMSNLYQHHAQEVGTPEFNHAFHSGDQLTAKFGSYSSTLN